MGASDVEQDNLITMESKSTQMYLRLNICKQIHFGLHFITGLIYPLFLFFGRQCSLFSPDVPMFDNSDNIGIYGRQFCILPDRQLKGLDHLHSDVPVHQVGHLSTDHTPHPTNASSSENRKVKN